MICSAAGATGVLLKKIFRYVAYAALLLFDAAFFIWFLHFYIGSSVTAEDILSIAINILGLIITLGGAVFFTVRFVKECKKQKEKR